MSAHPLSRRSFAFGSLAFALGGNAILAPRVTAQEATPTPASGDLASLGLPTLDIAVNSDNFEGAPDGDLAAGRYLITATIADGLEFGAAAFMSPPAGMSAEEFLTVALGGGGGTPPADEPAPEASPVAGGEQGSAEEEMQLPLFVYKATFAGGAGGPGSSTDQSVIDLPPGEWILWGDDPEASQPPSIFTVTGDMPGDLPEPASDITFTLVDFQIMVDGNLTAGDHIVKLQNHGAQPHFVILMKGPDAMTNDDIAAILAMEMGMAPGATPPALSFDPEKDLQEVTQSMTQSIGTTLWMTMSLEAGTYAAICFFPTAGTGVPHAMVGMHTVFTVQ